MARPIKPTHLKVVAGTMRSDRKNENEPVLPCKRPEMPATLSDGAEKVWPTVCGILEGMGVLTTADQFAVEGLCESYAELRAARDALADHGDLTYETTNKAGDTMFRARPEVAMVADADRRFSGWLTKCGMTPADRSRVSAAPTGQKNPFAEFG